MNHKNTFLNYYGRFFLMFFKDYVAWPRDNIVVAAIAVFFPPIIMYIKNPQAAIDWELLKTSLWLYLILLGIYTLIHLICIPWKIDNQKSSQILKYEAENTALLNKQKEADEATPNIVMHEPGAKHVRMIALTDGRVVIRTVPVLKVRFVNKPTKHVESAIARGVGAKVKFFSEGNKLILEMNGRWDDTDQPSQRLATQSRSDLLHVDFNFEEERNLDIAFLDTSIKQLIALNNDNFSYDSWRKPEHFLSGTRFLVEIRLVGLLIDVTYSLEFAADSTNEDIIIY